MTKSLMKQYGQEDEDGRVGNLREQTLHPCVLLLNTVQELGPL